MTEQRYTWYSDAECTKGEPAMMAWPGLPLLTLQAAWFTRDRAQFYSWPSLLKTAAWRDDVRGGWHLAPDGVRYVAVQGVKAGQRCAPFANEEGAAKRAASKLNHGDDGWAWHDGSDVDQGAPAEWCVLDLHDLADHRKPTGVHRPSDRVTIVMGDSFTAESPRQAAKRIRSQLASTTFTPDACKWTEMDHRNVVVCSCPGLSRREVTIAAIEGAGWAQIADGMASDRCAEGLRAWGRLNAPHLSGLRDSDPPRFQVKPAASMREGEPYIDAGNHSAEEWDRDDIAAATEDPEAWCFNRREDTEWITFLIDTHSEAWQAFDAKHRKGARQACWDCGRATLRDSGTCDDCASAHAVLPEIAKPQRHRWQKNEQRNCVECQCGAWAYTRLTSFPDVACEVAWKLYEERAKPQGPTDAAIVKAWEDAMRGLEAIGDWNEIAKVKRVGLSWCSAESGGSATWAQYQAARSRELHKRAAESREKDRQRVVCEDQYEL